MNEEKHQIIWQHNKRVPRHLEEVFYKTISYFPDLKESYIIVVESKFYGVQHTLRSYPPFLSLINKRKDRVYPIAINTNKDIPLSFCSLTIEQQQWILSHEMAHIVKYSRLSSRQIVVFWLRFAFSRRFLSSMEQATDRLAIARWCGNFLLAQRTYFWQTAKHTDYAKSMDAVYLNPTKIREEMKKYPQIYRDIDQTQAPHKTVAHIKREKNISSIEHGIKSIIWFITAISEMIRLVYFRRMHKKINWHK